MTVDRIRVGLAAVLLAAVVMPSPAECQAIGDVGLLRRDARAHIDAGGYVEAEREARALIASLGGLSGENQREVSRAADLLVEALARNGRAAEADTRTLAEEMVRRRETGSDADSSALATALRNLGDVLVQAGSYREAVAALERAQRSRQTAGTTGNLDAAIDFDYLTLALLPVGRYDEALDISGRALALKQKILAPTDAAIARTLEIRGRVWQRKGDYGRAAWTSNAHWRSERRRRHVTLMWRRPCCSLACSSRLKVRSPSHGSSSSEDSRWQRPHCGPTTRISRRFSETSRYRSRIKEI